MRTPVGIIAGLPYPGEEYFRSVAEENDEVPVYILSGRNLDPEKKGLDPFGNQRSRHPGLGVAWVKIGEGMSSEQILEETVTECSKKEARVEFSRFDLSPPLENSVPWKVKDDVKRHQAHPWVQAMIRQLDRSDHRNVTIFVHGYNTEFVENTLLAAEIYHYLGRQGAMISFEWPSKSSVLGYVADKGNATYSTRHFRALVSNIAKECDVDSITIIAHSAGSPIVVNALREIRLMEFDLTPEQLQKKYRVKQVVLAAPDMDMMAFINAVHDRFYEAAGRVAVYASPNDRALKISERLYSDRRLGRAVDNLEPWEQQVLNQVPQIEMVDASVAEMIYHNFLGHGYFHRDPWVSSDIGSFVLGRDPRDRGLVRSTDDVFWRFPSDFPGRLKQIADRRNQTRSAREHETDESPHTNRR